MCIRDSLNTYDRTDERDLRNRCEEADIVIVNKFPVNEITLAKMPNVKFIVVAATGYNNISIDVVKNRNIPVSNVKGYSAESVTHHVFASIFALLNKTDYYNLEVRNGRWSACPDFCFFDHSITEIAGKVMGIFGYGSIGKRVAEVAFAFGMHVFVTVNKPIYDKPDYITMVDKDTLFKKSDFLSLHCPLTNDTKEMINSDNLNKMKKQAILINTARGALVNENDLLEYWQDCKDVSVITYYLESFVDGEKFIKYFIDDRITKPVIVLKGGRTSSGIKAASSHTGALGSSDKVVDAILTQFGIIRADDLNDMFNLSLIHI